MGSGVRHGRLLFWKFKWGGGGGFRVVSQLGLDRAIAQGISCGPVTSGAQVPIPDHPYATCGR